MLLIDCTITIICIHTTPLDETNVFSSALISISVAAQRHIQYFNLEGV